MNERYVRRFLLLACLAGVMAMVVWTARERPRGATLERCREQGVIRVGYANEAPYGYLDASGDITGEAPEIARVVLSRLGIDEIEPVVTEFGALIPGLKAGRFDVIAAGMYITPARCREIAFSDPSYSIGEALLVHRGNPHSLHGFEDVAAKPAVRLGVVGGAVEHGYALAVGVPENRIILFDDNAAAVSGLLSERIDAFAATALTAEDLLRKSATDRIECAQPFRDPVINGKPVRGYGAFGFRQADAQLRQAFNTHLREFIGTPEHLELVRPFGFSEEHLPRGITAEELCSSQ